MTVATINSTVTVVVSAELGIDTTSQYAPAIAKVSEALEAREYDIVDAIAETANARYGVSKREVATILHEAGLSQRPAPVVVPEPAAEQDEDEAVTSDGKKSKGQRIADLEQGQAQILEALGSLTKNVADLGALAQRHLGSSL
jgi:hypothetical protein